MRSSFSKKLNETLHSRKQPVFRIYEWPLSYLVGLLIGLVVVSVFAIFNDDLRDNLQPAGTFVFLAGWVPIIGAGFGVGIEKHIKISPPTKAQMRIKKASVFLGIALSSIAFPLFSQPDEEKKENKPEMATPNQPPD